MALLIVAYVLVGLCAYRLSFRGSYARLTAASDEWGPPRQRDPDERFWMALLWAGPLGAIFWPIYFATRGALALAERIDEIEDETLERVAGVIGGESVEVKRERKMRERQRCLDRIDELERECAIGPYAKD